MVTVSEHGSSVTNSNSYGPPRLDGTNDSSSRTMIPDLDCELTWLFVKHGLWLTDRLEVPLCNADVVRAS